MTTDPWQESLDGLPISGRYPVENHPLWIETATALRKRWRFSFMDMQNDQSVVREICLVAALPVLSVGIRVYRHVASVVVYGGREARGVLGFYDGAIHLSWPVAAEDNDDDEDGSNLILHEFAHALDVQRGLVFHGMLPGGVPSPAFRIEFAQAYSEARVRAGLNTHPLFSEYALSDAKEFFAFAMEFFFEAPKDLMGRFPHLYHELCGVFGQDPAADQIERR